MPPDERATSGPWKAWIIALGPGAIVASLTIGTGELIFSSRAGALFGYPALTLFLVVLVLKWALVLSSARHWVLSDAHPLQRWTELPGPRGWLPWTLLLLALPAFPLWVAFHSGTIGTLLAAVTGTRDGLGGGASLAWGIVILLATLALSSTGGYARLEHLQTWVVAVMVLSVVVALILLKPDWSALLAGYFHPPPLRYPDWALDLDEFRRRPVWVEHATYAGVIGGSGYDYLAYVTWLRDKHGAGSGRVVAPRTLTRMVCLDATVSFLTVLAFSSVFVACGAILLGPQHQVPAGSDLLTLQAQFVRAVGTWLQPLYFTGAFLALAGTLYGTIEVAPSILRETVSALAGPARDLDLQRLRRWAVGWCGLGALAILVGTLISRHFLGATEPLDLIAFVTPANLFTGVLACGWISLLNLWIDRRFLPVGLRMNGLLAALNLAGGIAFTIAGLKGAWDHGRWSGPAILAGTVVAGMVLASATTGRNRVPESANHLRGAPR